jgi:hypothetical protein
MHHIGTRHHLEQFAAQMGQVAGPGRGQVDLAGIDLGIGNEFRDRFDRERRVDHEDERIIVGTRDRDDVARDGDRVLFIKGHVDGVRARNLQERVAIGRGAGDRL